MKQTLGILFIFFALSFSVNAQVSVKISNQTINLNGKKYYLHKVEIGQTLYSVSKAYNINQEEIRSINNLTSNNLKLGQLLKIPYTKIKDKDTSPDFFYHKVKQGETLFSLSQKYYVSIEEIIESNPEVKYGLKTDQILRIPNNFKKSRKEKKRAIFYTR